MPMVMIKASHQILVSKKHTKNTKKLRTAMSIKYAGLVTKFIIDNAGTKPHNITIIFYHKR